MIALNLSPIRRHIVEPLYLLKSGSPQLPYWKILEETQYYSYDRLRTIQWDRLRQLWDFLWEGNAFYRKRFERAGLSRASLQCVEDLKNIPLLTKQEIRSVHKELLSDNYNLQQLLHFKTGGSTGKSLDVYITEECSEKRHACARRHNRWTGWEPGEPIGAVWGNPELPETLKDRIRDAWLQPFIYLDTMAVSDETVLNFVRSWQKVQPTMLFGHAHSLYLLATYVARLGVTTIKPRGILSTSMMLLPSERRYIEEVFGVKVTDRYGCEEVSLIGCECEQHQGMHLNIEHLVIEFIKDDGTEAAPGEPGSIVVTDLMNRAMPFVRYKVEDVGIPSDRQCSCGRGLPLMEGVAGRVADFLIKPDGTRIAGISLIENTLTKIPGIDQMQIIQEDLCHIRLNIVQGKEYSGTSQEQLYTYFQTLFEDKVKIDIVQVSDILPEKSGKYRFSICRVPSP